MIMYKASPSSIFAMRDTDPNMQGKFIFLGDEKSYVRGTTYETAASIVGLPLE